MQFEWDEAKRAEVSAGRGVDLFAAARIFCGLTLDRIDGRFDDAETRMISVGMVADECYIVVHPTRADAVRLITAWKGGERDERRYQDSVARRTAPRG